MIERRLSYFGFDLDTEFEPIEGVIPRERNRPRNLLTQALMEGETTHPVASLRRVDRGASTSFGGDRGTLSSLSHEEIRIRIASSWRGSLAGRTSRVTGLFSSRQSSWTKRPEEPRRPPGHFAHPEAMQCHWTMRSKATSGCAACDCGKVSQNGSGQRSSPARPSPPVFAVQRGTIPYPGRQHSCPADAASNTLSGSCPKAHDDAESGGEGEAPPRKDEPGSGRPPGHRTLAPQRCIVHPDRG